MRKQQRRIKDALSNPNTKKGRYALMKQNDELGHREIKTYQQMYETLNEFVENISLPYNNPTKSNYKELRILYQKKVGNSLESRM